MCIRNINAISRLYDYANFDKQDPHKSIFQNQFDIISAKFDENGNPYIGGFYIITDINVLGTTKEEHKKDNFLESHKPFNVKIRITKINSEESKQYTWDIDTFTVNMANDDLIEKACVPFFNMANLTEVNRIILEKDDYIGKYVVKVLVQRDEDWVIQSITGLKVE